MPKRRSWTDKHLVLAVKESKSYRAVLIKLQLVPAGGNYVQVQRRVAEMNLQTSHFTGKGWNKGLSYELQSTTPVEKHLVQNSQIQSYKLKQKLFKTGLKKPECEICGWAVKSEDGRIPVELDHINGDHFDNRIDNLRILCPNCHSLQPTHRGRNKKAGLVKYR